MAPFYSARGASKSRQLAHQPTLLPAEPKGAAELLLLAAARDARWVAADSALVGAELFAPGSPDELRVALPLQPQYGEDWDGRFSLASSLDRMPVRDGVRSPPPVRESVFRSSSFD